MTGKVVQLRSDVAREGNPDPDIIKLLEGLLEEAKAGRIVSIGVAYARSDGRASTAIEANAKHFALSHACSTLWFRFLQEKLDQG